MSKFIEFPDEDKIQGWNNPDFVFYCPGCKCDHGVWTSKQNSKGAIWSFNGNKDCPTVTPSILISNNEMKYCCHSFITDGKIQYLDDCTHELAGQTIELPDYD